jgi:polyhydroxyalkanoate synthase
MRKVEVDAYVVGGITDHITPWAGLPRTARIYGSDTTFVLANSGHLQSLINPPDQSEGLFLHRQGRRRAPERWAAQANAPGRQLVAALAHLDRTAFRRKVAAPAKLGSRKFPAGEPAPGAYVREP